MGYVTETEQSIGSAFLRDGFVVADVEDRASLDLIRTKIIELTAQNLGLPMPDDEKRFLDGIAKFVKPQELNDLRLYLINELMQTPWFREAYFSTARSLISAVVGNELVMQRNLGLSILLPNDNDSVIRLHSDTWGSECSPFEVVVWLPFVDCMGTKSIFLCPPNPDRIWRQRLHEYADRGVEALFSDIERDLVWPTVPYGKVLLFTPTVIHGGRVNVEATTRWSINIRFKSLFSPYGGKRLGEYFDPISIRPASRIGMEFEYPEKFSE